MLLRCLPWTAVSAAAPIPLHSSIKVFNSIPKQLAFSLLSFCSTSDLHLTHHPDKHEHEQDNRRLQHLKPDLYLVGTPIRKSRSNPLSRDHRAVGLGRRPRPGLQYAT
ncbi:unnamed protein product [Lathyrus sativus]|nr:unnamed protein product [Lathyrus sativus]